MAGGREDDLCYTEIELVATLVNPAKTFGHESESVGRFLVVVYEKV